MSKTFTVFSGSDDRPDWLQMTPGHFDTSLLPKKHRKQDPTALFTVADLVTTTPKTAGRTAPELEGQADLFTETDS